jgi:predicted small lipoprotein YifL
LRDTPTVILFRRTIFVALVLAMPGLAACGQTGGLYQPPPDADGAARPASADA